MAKHKPKSYKYRSTKGKQSLKVRFTRDGKTLLATYPICLVEWVDADAVSDESLLAIANRPPHRQLDIGLLVEDGAHGRTVVLCQSYSLSSPAGTDHDFVRIPKSLVKSLTLV